MAYYGDLKIKKAANGYIVDPGGYYVGNLDRVFLTWEEVLEFLRTYEFVDSDPVASNEAQSTTSVVLQ